MLSALGVWVESAQWELLVGLFLLLACVESVRPVREIRGRTTSRWLTNIGLHLANAGLLRIVAPGLLASALVRWTGTAWQPLASLEQQVGQTVVLLAAILLLDLYAYGAHWVQHAVFPLWRLHAVHHADTEMDVSTSLRHHPAEVVVNATIGIPLFALLGVPEWAFPIYAGLALLSSLAQHANLALANGWERALRTVLITPGLHEVHHSTDPADHDSNYGTVFSFWDRMFGTFRAEPACGRHALAFGVEPFTTPAHAAPYWSLVLPFVIRREPARVVKELTAQ